MTYTLIRTKLQVWDQVLDAPLQGSVIVTPSVRPVKDAAGNRLLFSPATVHLDDQGWYEADLAASDDPALTPSGFGYTFDIRTKSFSYQFTTQVRLADATEVTETDPNTGVEYTHWELDLTGLAPVLPETPVSEAQALRDEMIALSSTTRTEMTALRDDANDATIAAEQAAASVNRGGPNGVAPLDASSKVPSANIPDAVKPDNGGKPVGKGELTFRVTDFGATGDGVTNDRVAINNASIAAGNAGSTGFAFGTPVVEFPWTPNAYIIATPFNAVAGVTYRGHRHATVKRGGGANLALLNCSAAADVTIEGLTLDGAGLITSGTVLVGQGTVVRDCHFIESAPQYAAAYAVNFPAVVGQTIEGVVIEGCTFTGLRSNIHIRGNTEGVVVRDNTITDWSSTAIAVDGDSGFASVGFVIEGNRIHSHDATTRAAVTKQIVGNVAKITLATAHPWVVGETIYVDVNDSAYDGNHTISAVDATSVSWAVVHVDDGPTATTGYMSSGNRQPISVQGMDSDTIFHEWFRISGNIVRGNGRNHQATDESGTADQISVHQSRDFLIEGNHSIDGGDCGITVSAKCHRGAVNDNIITRASNCGIAVGAKEVPWIRDLTIEGNTISNCGQNPVEYELGSIQWARVGINLRKLTGGYVGGNTLIDDQATPTMLHGISIGDTVGTCVDVEIGPNSYRGLGLSKHLTPAGNVRLVFTQRAQRNTKLADQSVDNITNPTGTPAGTGWVPLDDLAEVLEGNGVYEFEAWIIYFTNQQTSEDLALHWNVPAGTSMSWTSNGAGTAASGSSTNSTSSNRAHLTVNSTGVCGGSTGLTALVAQPTGTIEVGPDGGLAQLEFAQNTGSTDPVTVYAASWVRFTRIA